MGTVLSQGRVHRWPGQWGGVARLVVLRLGGGGFVAPIESNSPTPGIEIT